MTARRRDGIGILTKTKEEEPDERLREWGVDVLDKNSPERIPASLKGRLQGGAINLTWGNRTLDDLWLGVDRADYGRHGLRRPDSLLLAHEGIRPLAASMNLADQLTPAPGLGARRGKP